MAVGPQDHNLRAGIGSSEALAHRIHVGSLPGLFVMQGEDGPRALLLKGRGQGIKDGESLPPPADSPFGGCGCAVKRSVPAGQNSRRCGVTMAASLTSTDPLWLPDATMNSCSSTQAPPTEHPCGGRTCACPLHGPGRRGLVRELALAETKLVRVNKSLKAVIVLSTYYGMQTAKWSSPRAHLFG